MSVEGVILSIVAGFLGGVCARRLPDREKATVDPAKESEVFEAAQPTLEGSQESAPNFAVTGKPHGAPWRLRRRELQAGARKKRELLESFREIA